MKFKDLPIMSDKEGVVLFKPHIPKNAKKAINKTLIQGGLVKDLKRQI